VAVYYQRLICLVAPVPTATRSHSLRTKILAWSLVPTVLVLAAIALVSHFAYQAMAHDLVLDRDRELTRLLAAQLGSQLADYAGTPANLSRAEGVYEQEIVSQQSLFRRLVSSIRPRTGADGVAYLVNADRVTILHSDRSRVGETLTGLAAVDAVLAGETGARRTRDETGVEILTSYAPVPGTTWGLIIEQPWSSLTASITGYQRAILGLMAGGLLVLSLLVATGARRITGPLRQLMLASRAISEGDFQPRVTAATGDEIETLATQFNRMAVRLQDSYQALARRVTQRGRELTALNAVTAASSLARHLPDVLTSSLQELIQTLGLDAAAIWIQEPASADLAFAAGQGRPASLEAIRASPEIAVLAEQLLPGVGTDALGPADGMFPPRAFTEAEGGLVAVPVVARSGPLGLLVVLPAAGHTLGREAAQLLTTVGVQLGLAVESHRWFDDAQRRADLFQVLSDVGGHITSIHSLSELLRAIVASIHERLGYELVGIGLVEDGRVVMNAGAGGAWDREGYQPPRLVVGEQGLIGWATAHGESVLAPDVDADPRYVRLPDSAGIRSELVVPLRTADSVLGVLDVQSERRHAFTETDRSVLESLAAQAAIAIENIRLAERSRQMAVLEERTRIARDLHDAVSQTLWTAGLTAEILPDLWRTNRAEGRRSLLRLQQLTRGALAELRMLLLELRPAALAGADLGELLRQLADGTASRKKLRMIVRADGPTDLPVDVKIGFYRIAQEALANVVKHAQATQVQLLLETQGCAVRLRIEDNGRACPPTGARSGGLGMGIMRERAEALGAALAVNSVDGGGQWVEVSWPSQGESSVDE